MDTYSATRIKVMHTKLIPKEDYARLARMSDEEVLRYLQQHEYREDIEAMKVSELRDPAIVDRILAHNRRRTLEKLRRISSRRFDEALERMLRTNDLHNLMLIAIALTNKEDAKAALERYARTGTFDPARFASVPTIEALAHAARKHLPRGAPKDLAGFLALIERATPKLEARSSRFLIDEYNVLRILRGVHDGLASQDIVAGLARQGSIPRDVLQKAAESDPKGALETLRSTKYAQALGGDDFALLEELLHRQVLTRMRLATHLAPLGVDVLIHYFVAQEVEHDNLRVLIKGKQLGVDASFIEEVLV